MAYDYSRFQDLATRLLTKYGQSVTLTMQTAGAYNTATSTVAPGTPVVKTVHAVFKRPGAQGAAARDISKLIQFGDWDVVMSAVECGQLPKPGDSILRDGVTLLIDMSDEARPASVGIVYFCKLKT